MSIKKTDPAYRLSTLGEESAKARAAQCTAMLVARLADADPDALGLIVQHMPKIVESYITSIVLTMITYDCQFHYFDWENYHKYCA
jgi:hypothetical protein